MTPVRALYDYPKYWAECYGTAPFLPMSRTEMDELGWDSCDIIIVTGDAYVDAPSFGMAVMGRFLEAQGFRVGIISQPDWRDPDSVRVLGEPNLFFGVTAGNMDSMINHYTADRRLRSDDAYTAGDVAGQRPDRAVIVYTQLVRAAFAAAPVIIGGIEASLRRISQYDYWSDRVRRSVLLDSGADLLLFGNAERAIAEVAQRLANGEPIEALKDIRGTALRRVDPPAGWTEIDSTRIDWPGQIDLLPNPYEMDTAAQTQPDAPQAAGDAGDAAQPVRIVPLPLKSKASLDAARTYIRLPSFAKVRNDPVLYAHASRVLHQESNPGNAHALVQDHAGDDVWVNPPPVPLTTAEMDYVFGLTYQRRPHPRYGDAKIPAFEMIKTSVNIMRGCFGGCTFCSITEHEGRVIQSRSEESILAEIADIRDKVPGFTGTISDLGGPTANMYRLNCKSREVQEKCRRLSCVHPTICKHLNTDHAPTTKLYRAARAVPGVKRVLVASGLRYDLAVRDEEYVRELVTHHVGGYLKIAPEHSDDAVLDKMMKPGMDSYHRFKALFEKFSQAAGKRQYLIPYFIAAHPGSDVPQMLELALWLKANDFRVDQVQTFYPSPMALATAMYHSGRNPLKPLRYKRGERVFSAKALDERRLQKAFLRYHDEANFPLLREALVAIGRADLIGSRPGQLVPAEHRGSQRRGAAQDSGRRRKTGRSRPSQPARGGQWSGRH
ncbi:MAG: YgiQ family radical SAM protein [Pseudomonadota bacterium]